MPEISPEEFAIPFFAERGFTRRKCVSCGSNFWTEKSDQQTCGEAPCQPYTFIGNPPTKRRYNVPEMRIQFMDYFAEKGHTRIPPYPVVARWRDDVYLVGASIYDFQPYVTEGSMPPPANPLVISQPCIRFTDVELVGPTGGRHMTIFEMGGAHAFNYPEKEVYWKDECVRYHHQLLTGILGVPSESVTYKEHFWSGGGNAGPDLETIVAGLEIATLVFMQYKVQGDQLIPLPIRTVDTGYGIERWSWLSQGSPSGFHAVYAPVLQQVMDLAKVSVDPQLIEAFTRASSIHGWDSIKKNRESYIQTVSEQTGTSMDSLRQILSSIEAVYAITDHLKAAAFLLAEGVVPSNVGEGYLARLIIRRAGRLARQFGIYQDIPSIADAQIKFWGNDFRTLRDMRKEIQTGLETELRKYQETISRGSEVVVRLSKDLASRGIQKIPVEQLVQLYDSQGLSPEIVKEGAEKTGVAVEIPDNFLTLVAEHHSLPAQNLAEPRSETDIEAKLGDLPATRPLYYDDPYKAKFKAKVVARVLDNSVVLDQTAFYPQGGGQLSDHGELRFGNQKVGVVDVQKLERLANQTILRDLPVRINWMAREKAEAKYGYRLYQGGAVPGSKIRVVRIVGWDAEACGGTHVKRTGELGVFRIEKIDRLQDGVERIVFSAGEPALRRINHDTAELAATAELLKTTPDQLSRSAKALVAERDALEKELKKLEAKSLESRLRQFEKNAKVIGPIRLVVAKIPKRRGMDPLDIANRLKESDKKMVAAIIEASDRVQIVVAAGDEAVQAGINAGEIVSSAAMAVGGGGGGRPFFATGGGPDKDKAEDALKIVEEIIQRQLSTPTAREVA
ncbi:hypothetical protein E6H24_03910 [Candidatus Bathyarchaeota archaeon]|nr:MAG: hypothetical protein E6H24_03910 [Candidatus Bathyarchaeota archaeon]